MKNTKTKKRLLIFGSILLVCIFALTYGLLVHGIARAEAGTPQRDDMSREEQIQLMNECFKDAKAVYLPFSAMTTNTTAIMTHCFWEYRTR